MMKTDACKRLAERLVNGEWGERIDRANIAAADAIIDADPVWVDVRTAGEVIEGLGDYTVTHSGPPIAFEDMTLLHRRGMISACLFEGWAKNENEAIKLIESGKIRILSALDTNTDGSGTGIMTGSVPVLVVKDKKCGKVAALFPSEGPVHQGGFCGWGLYSPEIADNLRALREHLLPPIAEALRRMGGLPLRDIIAESLTMGDENHSRQTAAGLLLEHRLVPALLKLGPCASDSIRYLMETPRFFHNLGQAASRAACLANAGRAYSTVVTAAGGNGVEFGVKLAATGDEWFTAPSPMIRGKYLSEKTVASDQIPWCGDSSVTECAGLGGIAAAAAPIVCHTRGETLADGVAQTREMEKICVKNNPRYPIPNLDFDCLPVGIDARKVVSSGITPAIHGGMFSKDGGLLGAGVARIPMECFEKALVAFAEKYGL
ncbi:MAG: DUF1116 domain-containing protein [Clostridia bacterium]|nr:DUF1116 domain-containing protein [Clostridia bacterium]